MKVGYKRYLSFLINGLQKTYRENLFYITEDLEFGFYEYVLSQMHLGIVCHLYNRSLYTVHSVYKSLQENIDFDPQDLEKVLQWYYSDLAMFIQSISSTGHLSQIGFSLNVSLPLEEVCVEFEDEKTKILHTLETGIDSEYSNYIKLNFKEIKNFNDLFYSDTSMNRYIISIILLKFSDMCKGKVIKLGGIIPCY